MKAFQLIEPRRAEVRDVPEPEPAPGSVVLRVAGAGVCHSDLHILHADQALFPLPLTLGHEIAGTVAAVGAGVTGWEEGQPALVYLCWGCGRCRACAVGAENYCEAFPRQTVPGGGLGHDGGMAELVSVPARHLVALGELDPVDAAPLTDAALTPYHAVSSSRDRLGPGSTAVVVGVGGLGHMAVQILAATVAATVVAVDTDEGRLRTATELGAHRGVLSDERAAAEVLATTGGRGADVVLDFVGAPATLALAAGCVASAGQVTVVGLAGGNLAFGASAPPASLPWGASVVKPYGGTRRDLLDVVALARRGRIGVRTQRFGLAEAPAVLERLERGEIDGRAVLVP